MTTGKLISKFEVAKNEFKLCEFPGLHCIRRSIDEFQSRMLLKSLDRGDPNPQDRIIRTAREQSRKTAFVDRPKLEQKMTLSIFGTTQVPERKEQGHSGQQKHRILSLRKTANNYFTVAPKAAAVLTDKVIHEMRACRESATQSRIQQNQFLLKHSAKLRLLHNAIRPDKTIYLMIPVEFILQQFNFWQDQDIADQAQVAKVWKKLVSVGNIVWVVRTVKGFQKLQKFSQKHALTLDAVYLLEPKKNNRISVTVNLNHMQRDLGIADSKKLILFNIIDQNAQKDYLAFQNKIPLASHKYTYLHLIIASKATPGSTICRIPTILTHQPATKLDLRPVWPGYIQHIRQIQDDRTVLQRRRLNKTSELVIRKNAPSLQTRKLSVQHFSHKPPLKQELQSEQEQTSPQQDVLQKIEHFKEQWVGWILKMKVASAKAPEPGFSVQHLVGDLLKRNFPLLVRSYKQERKKRQKQLAKSTAVHKPTKQKKYEVNYEVPVFLWKF